MKIVNQRKKTKKKYLQNENKKQNRHDMITVNKRKGRHTSKLNKQSKHKAKKRYYRGESAAKIHVRKRGKWKSLMWEMETKYRRGKK